MKGENDLVHGAVECVSVSRYREHQWYEGDIRIFDRYFAPANRYNDVVEYEAAVREEGTEDRQFSSEIRVRYHDLAILVVRRVLPVQFDLFHALVDVSLVIDQRAVFYDPHHAENQRAGLFQYDVRISHLVIHEQNAGYQAKTEKTVTDDIYEPVDVLFEP